MKIKGRGAQTNTQNRFDHLVREEAIDPLYSEEEGWSKTEIINVYPKSIVNKVSSPDVGMAYSINPYQGCEHGCAYCYARNSHNYWGYSAGLDFEQKILVKEDAPRLLRDFLRNPSWDGTPIALSGNTDCYQPIEHKLKITRGLLEVFSEYEHPTAVISKNSLILRDLDILKPMSKKNLFKAAVSINTLDEKLRQKLEPRTASIANRIKTVRTLAKSGIPVKVMIAPVIPGLNSHEVMPLVKEAADWGATSVGYILVRLNGDVSKVFGDWIQQAFPDRADKVLNQIRECHGGSLSDSRFGLRMRGEGNMAQALRMQFDLARSKHFPNVSEDQQLDSSLYLRRANPQLNLFD